MLTKHDADELADLLDDVESNLCYEIQEDPEGVAELNLDIEEDIMDDESGPNICVGEEEVDEMHVSQLESAANESKRKWKTNTNTK